MYPHFFPFFLYRINSNGIKYTENMATAMPPPPPPPKPKSNNNNNKITNENQNIDIYLNNGSLPPEEEQVVMTPRGKTSNSTILLIERKLIEEISERVHVAGGDHKGIIINKDAIKGELKESEFVDILNLFPFFCCNT